jgi:carboxymethylenebutenolidase
MVTPTTKPVEIKVPSGRTVRADFAQPTRGGKTGGIIIIHEWWGLNDEMRAIAAEMAGEGYRALAVDVFEGQTTSDPNRARELVGAVDPSKARETLVSWLDWLRKSPDSNGKVATLGFCFGGAWSLNASLAAPVDATVIYYGNVKKTAEELKPLKGPVLGHFGRQDQAINVEMVEGFRAALETAQKPHQVYLYDANHAFARKGGPNFEPNSAALAQKRTLEFLGRHLKTNA